MIPLADFNNIDFQIIDDVYVSPAAEKKFSGFEKNYLKVRELEERILSPEEIRKLPVVDKKSPDHALWELRRKNISRFLAYLSGKSRPLRILDIGCGNGFFTNLMAQKGHHIIGVDVNLHELRQAAGIFSDSGIKWYYLDIMSGPVSAHKFDLITFCCSFHYFKDPALLLTLCRGMLSENGEIHIIDSPFYSERSRERARQRSLDYYRGRGVPEMISFYNHNTPGILKGFRHVFKYKPRKFLNRLFKLNDSPFPWIMLY